MRKYLLRLLIIFSCVGFCAFATKGKEKTSAGTTFLVFSTPSVLEKDKDIVRDPGKWEYVGIMDENMLTCPLDDWIACELVVDKNDTFIDAQHGDKIKLRPEVIIYTSSREAGSIRVDSYIGTAGSQPAWIRNTSK